MATPAPVPLQGKPDGGHVKFILHGARNLKNVQCCGRMDPYVRMTCGPNEEESPTCSGGHIQPTWTANPTYFFEIGRVTGSNYDKLKIEVRNHNCFCDDDIGLVEIPIEKIVPDAYRPEEPLWIWVGEVNNANAKAGELHATVKYVPPMTITVHEARNLTDVQLIGKQDPYVTLEMVGCLAKGDGGVRKTRTHDDGDRNPRWGESFKFNVLDENALRTVLDTASKAKLQSASEMKHNEPGLWLQVTDENVVVDKSIGYTHIPLLQLLELRRSGKPQFFALFKGEAKEGGRQGAGEICISVK